MMNGVFADSVRACLQKYADFDGRSRRSEYWYFGLFIFLLNAGISILEAIARHFYLGWFFALLSIIVSLGLMVPSLAVTVRRLHDLDRSGWWLLLVFIPLIGTIILIVWFCTLGTRGSNRFGSDPLPVRY